MKIEEAKTMVTVANELSESYVDLLQALKVTTREARATKKLWRSGNDSFLIKLGLTLIAFPDPTITDVIGSFLVAAGFVQAGIRKHGVYVGDISKTFSNTLKELCDIELNI